MLTQVYLRVSYLPSSAQYLQDAAKTVDDGTDELGVSLEGQTLHQRLDQAKPHGCLNEFHADYTNPSSMLR